MNIVSCFTFHIPSALLTTRNKSMIWPNCTHHVILPLWFHPTFPPVVNHHATRHSPPLGFSVRHAPFAFRRAPFRYLTIAYKKYLRFIQLFVFYMILTNGYHRTFCALLCGISSTCSILYYLRGFCKRNQ